MVNSRSYIYPTRQVSFEYLIQTAVYSTQNLQTYDMTIRGRLYSARCYKPQQVAVQTRADSKNMANRYPHPECLLDDAAVQPYIHNCDVHVHEGNHMYSFIMFFKRHCRLGFNNAILPIRGSTRARFRGDILVMRLSVRNAKGVVNMRERDSILSDWVINK